MSDPAALQVPVSQALTSDMLLGLKPSAPKSRSYRISIAPTNKSVFLPGDQIVWELPTSRRGTWLDQSQSYLKFSVQFASTAAAPSGGINLDNSAYSFFQRLDIFHSSNLIESQNEYGQLANFLIDTSLTQSDKAGISSLIGTNPNNSSYGYFVSPAAAITVSTAYPGTIFTNTLQTPGDRSGLTVASKTIAAGVGTAIPYTFSLPLLSGVIGVNASKMLPVGKLASPIRCEMYLSNNDDAIYYGTPGAGAIWQITNVEFCACYVEIQDDNLDMAMGQGEQQYISTTTYRHSPTTIPAATSGEFTTMLPFRCASLNAIYARFRNYASAVQGANATAAYRKGSSISPNLSSYYYRIGSSVYPNKPVYLLNGSLVGTGGEAMAELLKSFHALSSATGNSSLNHTTYNVAATAQQGFSLPFYPGDKTTSLDTCNNAFAIGLELQSFSNRSDTILSGVSTLNSQVYFTGIIQSGLTAGGAAKNFDYIMDSFAQLDMILVIQDGIMSAKY